MGADEPFDADVAVVGAGPVGLTLAGRLAQHGVGVLILEKEPRHTGEGSKALCMQRETLEIWDREGIGQAVADRGIQWQTGRTYYGTRELFHVVLPGASDERFPPFVNISQTEVEELLLDRCRELGVDIRWGCEVTGLAQDGRDGADAGADAERGVTLTLAGPTTVRARFVVGTDGSHSTVRHLLGVGFPGHSHEDLFLICDIRAKLPFPNERRFFFDPPWNPGRQVLIHPQPDDVWRIDWQVPPATDIEAERSGGGLDRRIRSVIGESIPYELVWMTVYRFHQRLADRFRVGNVFLVGDAAHLYSPFGARGLNSGAPDAENLAWKLALVLRGEAPDALLDSYEPERRAAAAENLAVTDETMRFMVPHGRVRRALRNLVLRGSTRSGFLRRRVNSGKLALPFVYAASPIVAPGPSDRALPRHGAVLVDVPVAMDGRTVRLRQLVPDRVFLLLVVASGEWAARSRPVPPRDVACDVLVLADAGPGAAAAAVPPGARPIGDPTGRLRATYAPRGDRAWLIRPDAHLAGSVALGPDDGLEGALALLDVAVGRRRA
jgi:2-polyprenyl-6-methoxyphenol hydroxylase-like FAD-dependent oxidoreductase